MHIECLPPHSRETLTRLNKIICSHHFVLAGGTGLALQLGHRVSVDLDFFSERPFSTEKVFQEIKRLGLAPIVQQEEKGTLTTIIDGTKVSMFHYPYPFVEKKLQVDGVPVAGIIDIASMKVMAISQRGAKRDFIDLYFILQEIPFWQVAENMIKRFGKDRINAVHIGKSMVYFNDAEVDPDPKYCGGEKPDWGAIKKFFLKNIQQIVIDLDNARNP